MQYLNTKQTVASVHACICLQVPNSNDFGDPTKTLHHTTAEESFNQEYRCFQEVTKCQVRHANQEKVPACTSEVSTVAAAALQHVGIMSSNVYLHLCAALPLSVYTDHTP